ncbi:LysR family transcriptional regulator [Tateyamaria sp. Alg231-49]|uniref:LysR family transcriptional regulator n=1 Tax=Tateyamaria sp. Alg231-49 TaxID=1922219 RepID=UPI000D556A70|nr:LysR family transcriptional regulator [Tateyamaria sp. Alg231-49]
MKNWDDLRILLALSRYKTMTSAAQALEMNTTTVSRRLERLTEEIGATLFVRRGTKLEPTPRAKPLIALADQLDTGFFANDARDGEEPPAARTLRISIGLQVLVSIANPHLAELLTSNPALEIEFVDEERSVAFGEVDLLVGFKKPTEGRLVRTQLGELGYHVYYNKKWENGPKGYVTLPQQGTVETECSTLLENLFGRPRLKASGLHFLRSFLKTMPLAACLPIKFAESDPELVPLNTEHPISYFPVWVSYHERRRLDPDVRIGIEFLRTCFSK